MENIILVMLIITYTVNSKLYIMSLNKLLSTKYKPVIYNLAFLLLAAIIILKQLSKLVFNNSIMLYITSALMLLVICCIVLYAYKNSWKKKIAILGLFFTATVFLDILSNIIGFILHIRLELMNRLTIENVLVSTLNTCLTLILYLLILKILSNTSQATDSIYKSNEHIVLSGISLIIFIPSIIVLNNIETVESNLKLVIIVEFAIILFVITFSSLKIFTKNIAISKAEYKSNALEREIKHYHDIAEVTEQLHQLRHDMNNHFMTVNSLIEQGSYDNAMEYIAQISEQIQTAKDVCLLDDKLLSIILSEKFSQARQKGIKLSHTIVTNNYFNELVGQFQDIDKTALFTNLLDNAITASSQTEEKEIDFSITAASADHIEIICINSKPEGQLQAKRNGTYISTKKEQGHGLGMNIIRETVWKYKGIVNYNVSDTMFMTKIDFYRKE